MDDNYKNIDKYNSNKKHKILFAFNDMIADMINNKKCNQIVIQLSIRGRNVNFSLVFNTQSYFAVTKYIRLNYTYYFTMKVPNKNKKINHCI